MFHISADQLREVESRNRPFLENIQIELDRVSFAYFSIESINSKSQLCQGKLCGGKCKRSNCERCTEDHSVSYPMCGNCKEDLEVHHSYRFNCRHLICDQCLEKVPARFDALSLYRCSICLEYGFAQALY